jgi:tripeptide aminopeptidase
MKEKMIARFFRYVKIDTQSQEGVEDRYPSTEKQKDLLELLVDELKELGLKDVEMDKYGYVTATFPGNLTKEENAKVPVIGLLAHVDTSPDVSGANVKPVIHKNYDGGDIVLPGDPKVVLKAAENPALKEHIGDDIITSDGTTLLGADNKAGIAEIMTLFEYLKNHPEVRHGTIRVAFTPDEEVGAGTKYFDVKKFNADYAYTIDGETVGEIEPLTPPEQLLQCMVSMSIPVMPRIN